MAHTALGDSRTIGQERLIGAHGAGRQQVAVVAPTMAFQQPPGCCCRFWCPCLAVCCHEGCTCNLGGALCLGCLFTTFCWTPQTIPLPVTATDMER